MQTTRVSAVPTQRLRLADHVRSCRIDDQVILLDLRRNRYLGLPGHCLATACGGVDGEPAAERAERDGASALVPDAFIADLRANGMLAGDGAVRPDRKAFVEASSSLNALDACPSPKLGPACVARFLRSAVGAWLSLRLRSLDSIARSVEARHERIERRGRRPAPEAVCQAVAAYEWLRPLLLTSRDKCLYDSLALVDFLARAGIAADWIIGVRTAPFGAHSWVQLGDTVLNDQHARVRSFTAILVA